MSRRNRWVARPALVTNGAVTLSLLTRLRIRAYAYQHSTQCRTAVRPAKFPDQPHRQACVNKRLATCSRSSCLLEQAAATGPPHWKHLNTRTWAKLRTSRFRASIFTTEVDGREYPRAAAFKHRVAPGSQAKTLLRSAFPFKEAAAELSRSATQYLQDSLTILIEVIVKWPCSLSSFFTPVSAAASFASSLRLCSFELDTTPVAVTV